MTEFLLLGLGCLETECRHLVSNPVRYELDIFYYVFSRKS